MKKDVKTNLPDHSGAKVRLLSEYLKRYFGIISNLEYVERIKIYDLFCSEGLYDDGGQGSPLVILQAVNDLVDSGVVKKKIPPIDCCFNDIDIKKIDKLKRIVENRELWKDRYGSIVFTNRDYRDEIQNLERLLPRLKNEKIFIFIDPYGYKEISVNDIRNLLLNKNSEVLLFLPTQFMYRFDKKGTPEALKRFIEELVQYENWNETESVWNFINQLKEGFRDSLGIDYFVDTFTIQKDAQSVFCLFFFSSHIRGFEKMLEAKWNIDEEQGKGWEYKRQGPSLFSGFKTNPLEEKMKEFLKPGRYNGEVYFFTLHQGFLPKHAFQILEEWQRNNKLIVTPSSGSRIKKRAFYISYENYKEEPNRVHFKIQ